MIRSTSANLVRSSTPVKSQVASAKAKPAPSPLDRSVVGGFGGFGGEDSGW